MNEYYPLNLVPFELSVEYTDGTKKKIYCTTREAALNYLHNEGDHVVYWEILQK